MAEFRFEPDHKGIAQLLVSPGFHRLVAERAARGMAHAISISPDAEPYGEGYIAAFDVESGVENVAGSKRAVARLVNTSPHATLVEYANGDRVLGRTVDAIERG